ncbi:MAG: ATP-binding protein [Sphingopyxis sp.]
MPSSFASFLVAAIILIFGGGVALANGAPIVAVAAMLATAIAAVIAVTFGRVNDPGATSAHHETPTSPAVLHQTLYSHPGFDDLVNAMTFPVLIAKDNSIVAANRAACDLLGGFIIGTDVRAAIRHPAAADRLDNPQTYLANETIDLVGIGHPGERWEMQAMPLIDGSQLVLLRDKTTSDAVERMRADFVANASHELRTPLAAIIGYVETLLEPEAGSDAPLRKRFLTIVDIEARRMVQLVADLMSISRIEASKGDVSTEEIDLGGLVRTVVDELVASGESRAKCIALDCQSIFVRGDRAQLSQLVHNLASNAMKYGRDETPILLSVTTTANSMALLSVVDRGEGIANEHLPRLTERFYRVDSARSRTLGGTGLGLAIVKHVVNRHRGRLEIDSLVGIGTTVRVRIPMIVP